MPELPTGTVTFLFTDLEGSTRLWEAHPEEMPDALARHDSILEQAVRAHGGIVFSRMGDGVAAVFASAADALTAVLDAQRDLGSAYWGETGALRARMGLHTDEGRLRAPGEYVNRPLNRCARLMGIAHGGQVLVSDSTATVARDGLPDGAGFLDLGAHRLRDLAEPVQVFQLVHPDLRAQFDPVRSLDVLPGNLPLQPTEFVGRDEDLAELEEALRLSRVVTLTGVGGVGKTRLAVQAAAEVVADHPEGAWFCGLGALRAADAVGEALAATFGVQAQLARTLDDTVLNFLRAKRLLLVLDNCEHLLDAVATLVTRIVGECAEVRVLATSREGLGLRGERLIAVRSLGLPGPRDDLEAALGSDALRLFAARAAESRPGFEVTAENAAAVTDLCRRLDGIPLAIELAAARVRSMSPAEIVSRLDHRFRLLTGGGRTALERHQTLRRAVDWSYELLGPTEQIVLNRLAVFTGGFDLTAAEAVAAGDAVDDFAVLDALAQLVDKSLVIADDENGTTRYRLLETIRQYAQERLEQTGEADEVRQRHAEHYAAFVEDAAPHLRGRDQIAWLARVEPEIENLRGAVTWAIETGDADVALRLVHAAAVNAVQMSYTTHAWADAAVAMPNAREHPLVADVLGWAAWGAVFGQDFEHARELVAEMRDAEQRLGLSPSAARCQGPATLAMFTGQLDEAAQHAAEWVELARAAGDDEQIVQGLTMAASVRHGIPDTDVDASLAEEAVAAARRLGAPGLLAFALVALGTALLLRNDGDDLDRALVLLDEAIDVGSRVGNAQAMNHIAYLIAMIRRLQGDTAGALRAALDAAQGGHDIGNPGSTAAGVSIVGRILGDLGEHESAVTLIGYSRRVADYIGAPRDELENTRLIDRATDALGAERVAEHSDRGAALSDAAAIEAARRMAAPFLERGRDAASP